MSACAACAAAADSSRRFCPSCGRSLAPADARPSGQVNLPRGAIVLGSLLAAHAICDLGLVHGSFIEVVVWNLDTEDADPYPGPILALFIAAFSGAFLGSIWVSASLLAARARAAAGRLIPDDRWLVRMAGWSLAVGLASTSVTLMAVDWPFLLEDFATGPTPLAAISSVLDALPPVPENAPLSGVFQVAHVATGPAVIIGTVLVLAARGRTNAG